MSKIIEFSKYRSFQAPLLTEEPPNPAVLRIMEWERKLDRVIEFLERLEKKLNLV